MMGVSVLRLVRGSPERDFDLSFSICLIFLLGICNYNMICFGQIFPEVRILDDCNLVVLVVLV